MGYHEYVKTAEGVALDVEGSAYAEAHRRPITDGSNSWQVAERAEREASLAASFAFLRSFVEQMVADVGEHEDIETRVKLRKLAEDVAFEMDETDRILFTAATRPSQQPSMGDRLRAMIEERPTREEVEAMVNAARQGGSHSH